MMVMVGARSRVSDLTGIAKEFRWRQIIVMSTNVEFIRELRHKNPSGVKRVHSSGTRSISLLRSGFCGWRAYKLTIHVMSKDRGFDDSAAQPLLPLNRFFSSRATAHKSVILLLNGQSGNNCNTPPDENWITASDICFYRSYPSISTDKTTHTILVFYTASTPITYNSL